MSLLVIVLTSFVGSVTYAIITNCPPKSLIYGGSVGAVAGFTQLELAQADHVPVIASVFLATVLVALASEFLARYHKFPSTIFLVPGILPLVPGTFAYETMFSVVRGHYTQAIAQGVETLGWGLAIAVGIATVSVGIRFTNPKH